MKPVLAVLLAAACGGGTRSAAPAGPTANPVVEVVYELDVEGAIAMRLGDVARDLELALLDLKIDGTVWLPAAGTMELDVVDPVRRDEVRAIIKDKHRETLEPRDCDAIARPEALCFGLAGALKATLERASIAAAVETIRVRLAELKLRDATVSARGDQIVLELAERDADRNPVARAGHLEFVTVDDGSDYMSRLYRHVGVQQPAGTATDPAAAALDISVDIDQWKADDDTRRRFDPFLFARDRTELVDAATAKQLGCAAAKAVAGKVECLVTGRARIERYLRDLARRDPRSWVVPHDRRIVFERETPHDTARDQRPFDRTYYVEALASLTGKSVSNATPAYDPNSGSPVVLLDFNRNGTRVLGELTTRIVGKKLAIVLDGVVASAPVINQTISGGRASIAMGGSDPARKEREAKELVLVLRTGSLPAPLREVSRRTR